MGHSDVRQSYQGEIMSSAKSVSISKSQSVTGDAISQATKG